MQRRTEPILRLTWPKAAAWRMGRHHFDKRAPAGRMLAVASRLCGLHAQVMSSAELTLWARVEGLKRQAVQRALWEDRTLVKTWPMRGTLHWRRSPPHLFAGWPGERRGSLRNQRQELHAGTDGLSGASFQRRFCSGCLSTTGNLHGPGAIVNQDGTVNSAGNPAPAGSIVFV